MTTFVAFLRAVNVGGTGKLPMSELRAMCNEIGFESVQTYIASGNIVFRSEQSAKAVKAALAARLREYASKDVGVIIRTASEIRRVLKKNPFTDKAPNYTLAVLLDDKPAEDALAAVSGHTDEEMRLGDREIYVYYPAGVGRSKLKIPAAKVGTARNMNTIRKMVELSGQLDARSTGLVAGPPQPDSS